MQEKSKLVAEIDLVLGIKMLAEAYEEISVIKMQSARTSVLKTREFLNELSEVFYDVKDSYRKQIAQLLKQKKDKRVVSFSTLAKNNKEVSVFISSNAKLYGDIIHKTFNLFAQDSDLSKADIVIVGKYGKEFFDQKETGRPYTYFEIPDTDVTARDIQPLIAHVLGYGRVTVYYGKFINIVSQAPAAADISGQQSLIPTEESEDTGSQIKFWFEPSLDKILNFFETQIFSSLFKQTVHESELSRYASRIKAMEEALENIGSHVTQLGSQMKRLKNMQNNKKQLETISGMSLWNK